MTDLNELTIDEEVNVKTPVSKPITVDNDLHNFVKNVESTPEEAAKNINNSKFYDINPDSYKIHSKDFDKEIDTINRLPDKVEESLQEFITASKENASVAKDDYSHLNFAEKRIKYYKNRIVDIPNLRRESNEYWNRIVDGEKLTPEEEEYLSDLDFSLSDLESKTFGIDDEGEKFAVETLSGAGDILRSYYERKEIMAGSVATGAAVGGLATLGIPIPGARVVGLASGARVGFQVGATIVGGLDGYYQTRASVYKELEFATKELGVLATSEPLKIDRDTKVLAATGAAFLSGAISAASSFFLTRVNPLATRFVSGKSVVNVLMKSPALLAKTKILGSMLQSAIAEGGEEFFQEIIQIASVEFGKMDASNASFENVLDNILSLETFKRAGYAGAVGASTGGVFAGTSGVLAYKGLKKKFGQAQDVVRKREAKLNEQAIEVNKKENTLSKQNQLLEVSSALNQTKMSKLLPEETSNFVKSIYDKLPVNEDLYYYLEDLREFANDPEKGKIVRNIIDKSGQLNQLAPELNLHLKFQENEILEVTRSYPEFSDYLRLDVEGKSPKEIMSEAAIQVERINAAEEKRKEFNTKLEVGKPLTPEQEFELQTILNPEPLTKEGSKSKIDFLDFERFEPIEGIVSQEEVDVLNNIELDAKLEVANQLEAEVDEIYRKSENVIVRDVTKKKINAELQNLEQEFNIIDKFKDTKNNSEAALAITNKHAKKGFSPLAIDPDSLPPLLRKQYLEIPELKKKLNRRKAFVKGGIHIDEALALTGIDDAEQLIKILVETPTKTKVKQIGDQRKIAIRNKVQQTILPSKKLARDRAFTNVTKTRLKQMEHIALKEYPTIKRGAIKIAGKVPSVESLNRKAKRMISKLQVKNIRTSPKRFENGEIRSRKKAMQNWVNTEFEQAFKNLEASALNSELRKEALNAQDTIRKYKKFWRDTVNTPSNQKALRNSGMLEAMNEFTDVYKMSTNATGQRELKSFNSFLKRQVQEGKFVLAVPERLKDVRMSARDMTMEQFKAVGEMGEFILHQAKLKNKLLTVQQKRKDFITADRIAKGVEDNLVTHPNYDPTRAKEVATDYLSVTDRWKDKVKTGMTLVNTIKVSVMELDNFKPGQFFQEIIGDPVKHTRDGKRHEIGSIEASDMKILNQYGMKKFQKMFNDFVFIPQLVNRLNIGDGKGKIRKIDLLTMQAYRGDPDGRVALEQFLNGDKEPLSIATIEAILEEHLTLEDAALVQSMMVDRFNRFRDRSFKLNKETTGVELDMVEGVPFTHRGKEFPGGYYPMKRKMVPDDLKAQSHLEKVKQEFGKFTGAADSHFFAKFRAAEMTKQGRSKERTGSERPLDIKFENITEFTEEFVHDLHYRKLGIDLLKILKNPENVINMKSVLGDNKYGNFLNSVKDLISKTSEEESSIFSEEYGKINSFIDGVHSLHAVKAIGGNLKSAAVQADSLLTLGLRAGPKTNLYLFKTAKKMIQNPMMFDKYAEIANEINPDVGFEKDGIDNAIIKKGNSWIPARSAFFKKYDTKSAQTISSIRQVQQKGIDASFYFVREGDRINRILGTLALSEQFLNGDIDGFPLEVIAKMTDKEKAAKMSSVVRQLVDLSLTANAPEDQPALQKIPMFKMMLRYWVDRRSRLNSMLAQGQKIGINIKQKQYGKAVGNMMNLALVSGISLAYMEAVRVGFKKTYDKLKVKDADDALELASDVAWHFFTAPFQQLADMTPIVDNINYAANLDIKSDYRNVSTPFFGVMSDVAMGAIAFTDALRAARKLRTPNISDVHLKAVLADLGYIVGGAPTSAVIKFGQFVESRPIRKTGVFFKNAYKDLNNEINLFIDAYKGVKGTEKFIKDLKEYQSTVIPKNQRNIDELIPEDAMEVMKLNEWSDYDPDTGASGIYQFTEKRWQEISEIAPNLALTENGRVSKESAEQEKAMQWELEDNTKALLVFRIEPNNANLYGAHRFGLEDYIVVALSKGDKKLNKLVSDMTLFKGFTSVKQVKSYISRQLNKGK